MTRRFAPSLLIIAFMMLLLPVMAANGGPEIVTPPIPTPPGEFLNGVASGAGFSTTGGATPVTIAGALVNTFLSLIGIIFIILIIYAGFKWMTAGGNEEQVKKAKSTIVNSVIGIVVVMGAWFIYAFVGRILGI